MYQKMNQGLMPDQTSFPQQIHLSDYLNIIRKRKWVVITFFLTVVCIVAYKTYKTTPVYKATAQIIIEGKSSIMDDMADIMGIDTRQGYHETQQKLLQSRNVASKAIEDLGLREYLANRFQQRPNFLTTALNRIKNFIGTFLSPSDSNTSDTRSLLFKEQSESEHVPKDNDPVVSWYLSNLEIIPVEPTHLVGVSFFDQSPKMAARIANAHAHAFIERSFQEQRMISQQALNWLNTKIREQKIKVEASKQKLNEYKYQQLGALSIEDENLFSLPEIEENAAIQNIRNQLTALRLKKVEMAAKYGPKYPKIVEINTSIKKSEHEIIDEIERIRMSIKTKLDQTASLEKTIQQPQDVQQQVAVPLNEKVTNYEILQFEAESDKEIYDILLKQAEEISLTGNMEKHNIRIVDEAEVPLSPVVPKKIMNMLMSVVIGLTFGSGLALFLEYMDKTVRTPEDIMQHMGMTVLGLLPYDKSLKRNKALALPLNESNHKQKKRIGYYRQYDISESLITGLPLMQARMSGQVFMVESATAGEGKSTVLAKSAVSLARGGLRVLMVDADLQRSSLNRLFGLNGERGLINAMARVLSYNIRQGTLDKYSLDDLFSLIALKKQSGKLVVTNDTQSISAVFENGHLFYLQNQNVPFANRLGTTLLQGGFITESQLKDALERNKRTGQPLGYILINAGYVNQDKLRGPIKLQMEEYIHKLFSWKQGTFVFEPGSIETYEDKRIYFQEDYTPIINRLGRMAGSRLLENGILSYVKSVDEPNLALLPAGTGNKKVEGLLQLTLLAKFLDIFKQRFDVVLVDAPPVLEAMGYVRSLVSLVDGVIFVVRSGHVSVKAVNEATNYLNETKIIGAILNGVKISRNYYGYY